MKQKLLDWFRSLGGARPGTLHIYDSAGTEITEAFEGWQQALRTGEELTEALNLSASALLAAEQTITEQTDRIAALRQEITALRHEVSVKDKMAQTLRDEYPQLYIRYFTKRGADDRAAGRPTKTGIKPKRRRA